MAYQKKEIQLLPPVTIARVFWLRYQNHFSSKGQCAQYLSEHPELLGVESISAKALEKNLLGKDWERTFKTQLWKVYQQKIFRDMAAWTTASKEMRAFGKINRQKSKNDPSH